MLSESAIHFYYGRSRHFRARGAGTIAFGVDVIRARSPPFTGYKYELCTISGMPGRVHDCSWNGLSGYGGVIGEKSTARAQPLSVALSDCKSGSAAVSSGSGGCAICPI